MKRRRMNNTDSRSHSEHVSIISMLKQYGESLFDPCPSSEQLVLYTEDRTLLSDQDSLSIQQHLMMCLDCRDKVRWLTESEEADSDHLAYHTAVLSLPVIREPLENMRSEHPLALAAGSRDQGIDSLPPVPYVENQDGTLHGEIGQDFNHHLFLYLDRVPSPYRWSSIQVRALTKDQQCLETRLTSLTDPKIIIAQRADIKPEDLIHIELRFTRLRP